MVKEKELDQEIRDVKKAYIKRLQQEAETGSINPDLGILGAIKTYLCQLLAIKNNSQPPKQSDKDF